MEYLFANVYNVSTGRFNPKRLGLEAGRWTHTDDAPGETPELYVAPGFIDAHAHVYPGATDLGIHADEVGLQHGVHLVVDAGSAGSTNYPCFRDCIMPGETVAIKAFLNISRAGLVTKQPYYDRRNLDADAALATLREDGGKNLLGIKVLSSGLVVEDAGLEPLVCGLQTAEKAGCRLMVHLVEGPPKNEDTMALLRGGDSITHCFHGAPNLAANSKAGARMNPAYCSEANVMWNPDGSPTKPLEAALARGVLLDVGHGAASFSAEVARAAIAAGVRAFSISTDAHCRNISTVVRSLPHTMSKFLALGMPLADVVASVTTIPARQMGLGGWCDNPASRATVFTIRDVQGGDAPLLDSAGLEIPSTQRIEPVANIIGGQWTEIPVAV